MEKSKKAGLPIIIESFEEDSLIDFRYKFKTDLPLVYLMWNPIYNLTHISSFAHAIGPNQDLFISESNIFKPSALIDEAHSLGLLVHGYTF